MLKRVETIRTKFSVSDFVSSMISAWKEIYGNFPDKKSIGVIFAQWSLETGQGTSCWNNNIGNIKAKDITSEVIEYCVLNGVWEIVNGQKIILPPENPGSWFRSFPTLDKGVKFHFSFLRDQRYKIAWKAIEQGDPTEFSHLLRQQGYYTAPEIDYTRQMNYYFNIFMKGNIFDQCLKQLSEQPIIVDPIIKEQPVVIDSPNIQPAPIPQPIIVPVPNNNNQFGNVIKTLLGYLFPVLKYLFHIR